MLEPTPEVEQKTINFYKPGESHGYLSNFSLDFILLEGKSWPTVEHYFQAKKFEGTPHEETVRNARTPGQAKKLGGDRNGPYPLRKDWARVKETVMFDGLMAKFTQHQDLGVKLKNTVGFTLVEHTQKDSYWGDGGGSGKNRLGVLLMKVRDILNNQTVENSSETKKPETEEIPLEKNTNTEIDMGSLEDRTVVNVNNTQVSKKKGKNRKKRNIWKDGTGASLFEIDNDSKGKAGGQTVSLTGGQDIHIPYSALPKEAKFVVKRNQYVRKHQSQQFEEDQPDPSLADEQESEFRPANFSDEDEDDDEDEDMDQYRYNPPHRTSLAAFINVKSDKQDSKSTDSCLEKAKLHLEFFNSLPVGDPEREKIKNSLVQIEKEIIRHIQVDSQSFDETLMNQFIQTLEEVKKAIL